MDRLRCGVLALCAAAGCAGPRAPAGDAPAPSAPEPTISAQPGAPVAVLELFTSEGCSSCPPADDLLRELADAPGVIALSFHVDYWNDLGWPDPWSDRAFTARQRAYAQALGDPRVYTPELVVGGREAFVGSDAAAARAAIRRAIAGAQAASLSVRVVSPDGARPLRVAWEAAGVRDAALDVVWIDRDRTSRPARGENVGRLLHHVNVVRALATTDVDAPGRGELSLDVPVHASDGGVVALLRRRQDLSVLAAATAPPTERSSVRQE